MLSHALRRRTRHTSIFRLRPHQHFNHTLTPTSEEEVTTEADPSRRTAFIQTWEPFHNLADAWVLLRAVERKYGKVLEAQFIKDYEMTNRYQMYTYVVFSDPKSIAKIPKKGYTFKISAPVMEDRPGGPGLDDIKHLLESADEVKDFEFELSPVPRGRVIGARILSTPQGYFTVPKLHPVTPNKALARAFLKWRGFHKPEPFARESHKFWFGKPAWERMAMTAAMDLCSKVAEIVNPAVRKPKTNKNDGEVSDSNPASSSMKPPESSSHGKVSDSTSMDSPEPSSPTTLDIPISHESTPPKPTPPKPTTAPGLTPEQKNTQQRQMDRAKQIIAKKKKSTSKKKSQKSNKEPEEEKPKDQLEKSTEEPLDATSKGIVATFWKLIGR